LDVLRERTLFDFVEIKIGFRRAPNEAGETRMQTP
jgi:hypothetical protein